MFTIIREKITGSIIKIIYCANEIMIGVALNILASELARWEEADFMKTAIALGVIIFALAWHRPLRKQKENYDVIYDICDDGLNIIREGSPLREKLVVALGCIGMGIEIGYLIRLPVTGKMGGDFGRSFASVFEYFVFRYIVTPYMSADGHKRIMGSSIGYAMVVFQVLIVFIFRSSFPLFDPLNYAPFIAIGILGAWVAAAAHHGGRKNINIVVLVMAVANVFLQIFLNFEGDSESVYRLTAATVLTADLTLQLVATLTKTHPIIKFDLFDFDDSGE